MLITCPECKLQVSDKAHSCPHCGYPMVTSVASNKPSKSKRKRLPNGFGQISKIQNRNLQKPYRAMVSVGTSENGRPICKMLKPEAYFKTYNEAYAALVEYNKNPYDFSQDMTMNELYTKWIEIYRTKVKNINVINTSWSYCSYLHNMKVREVRPKDIKTCIDTANITFKNGTVKKPTGNMKDRMKSTLNLLFDYAVEFDLTDKNYSRNIRLSNIVPSEELNIQRHHITFSLDEMETLWLNEGNIIADMLLVMCYSGWRPQELLNLKSSDVSDGFFTGGMKTKAGTDRIVPIHSAIENIIERHKGNGRLFDVDWSYGVFRRHFEQFKEEYSLNPGHRLHDCRKHFISRAKAYDLNEYAIKYIVGHSISDITEKVYTERDPKWLKSEIEKIKKECRNSVGTN